MRSDIKPIGNVWRRPLPVIESHARKAEALQAQNSKMAAGPTVSRTPSDASKLKQGSSNALFTTSPKPQAIRYEPSRDENKYSLPYLVRSLSNECPVQRLAALRLLPGVIRDLSMANTAISLDIVEKATVLYRRFRQGLVKERFNETSMLLKLFLTLSGFAKSATQLAEKTFLIKELYRCILDMESGQNLAASILCNISAKSEAVKALVNHNNVFESIRLIFERDVCTIYYPSELWRHMVHVLEEAPEQGVAANLMKTLIVRINNRITDFNSYNMKCVALMLKHDTGQRAFEALRGMSVLYELLSPTTPKLDNYEYILLALRNAVRSDTLLFACTEFNDMADILTNLAKITRSSTEQMYCFQIIANLNTVTQLQQGIHERCMHELSRVNCLSGESEHSRLQLVAGWAKMKLDL